MRHTLWLFFICLAIPAAHAQESSRVVLPQTQNFYINAVATLYEQGRFTEALSKLERALEWKSNGPEEIVWLKVMQGVLQAELSQDEALESFKQALALDKDAQLPFQANRRLRKLFEQARDTLGLPADKTLLAQELEQNAAASKTPRSAAPPPRRYGWSLGVRGELDVLEPILTSVQDTEESPSELKFTAALSPAVSLGYNQQKWGGVATVLVQSAPGLRAEGQFHPLTLSWVRPYARLGATAFFAEKDAQGNTVPLGSVGGRAALGVDVQFTSRLSAFADVAYEHFFVTGERYRPQSVLISVGVGLFP
ncbi:hypothetical protein [Archangium violaceum]|uniref:Uncharacterized protein n=1 Tax=Archangium violaceum Cb vi76 TaxID=1406225 RepID=A0A084SZ16_9BACT|nr:hypothetical protein [Archangium violaceum]KFA93701.1 hypothetical protein Q664_08050 [Archangium violaceum Cb vi76]